MQNAHRDLIERLDAMPIDEARQAIAAGQFGAIGSSNHSVALAWIEAMEANARDEREEAALSIARKAL